MPSNFQIKKSLNKYFSKSNSKTKIYDWRKKIAERKASATLPYVNLQYPNEQRFQLFVPYDKGKEQDIISALQLLNITITAKGCDNPTIFFDDPRCYHKPESDYDLSSTPVSLYKCDDKYNGNTNDLEILRDMLTNNCKVPPPKEIDALELGLVIGLPLLGFAIVFLLFHLWDRRRQRFALADANYPLMNEGNENVPEFKIDVIEENNSEAKSHENTSVKVQLTLRQRLEKCYQGEIDPEYCDSITPQLMNDPIMLHCGDNFDRENLASIKRNCNSCPNCREPFHKDDFKNPARNTFLRNKIIKFVEEKEKIFNESKNNNATEIIEASGKKESNIKLKS